MHQLQLHRKRLRELCLPPGYNYNYMNYFLTNYLRNDFVDHGKHVSGGSTGEIGWGPKSYVEKDLCFFCSSPSRDCVLKTLKSLKKEPIRRSHILSA